MPKEEGWPKVKRKAPAVRKPLREWAARRKVDREAPAEGLLLEAYASEACCARLAPVVARAQSQSAHCRWRRMVSTGLPSCPVPCLTMVVGAELVPVCCGWLFTARDADWLREIALAPLRSATPCVRAQQSRSPPAGTSLS